MKLKLIIALFIFTGLYAQDKLFTMEDVVFNSYSSLAPSYVRGLQFIPNSESYSFIKKDGKNQFLVRSEFEGDNENTIVSLSDISESMKDVGGELKSFPRYKWESKNSFTFWKNSEYFKFNTDTKKIKSVVKLPSEAQNIELAPNHISAAYTIENNLYAKVDGKDIQITNEKEGIVCGQSVHRNEFGIMGGIFWSPKSNFLAFYRMDESMVTDFPLVDLTTVPATVANIKYPMAGQKSHEVTLGIFNPKTEKTIFLNTGAHKEHYLTCVTWDPSEKFIYIALLNRDQNHMKLNKYDASTGELVKTLFEEKNDKFVEPEHPLYFIPNKNDEFLWFSERDGFDHLYRYNTDGKLINQVTSGEFPVISVNGFDEDSEYIYFTSDKESPLDLDLYKSNIETGEITRLTKGEGTHRVAGNTSGSYFIDRFSNIETPGITRIIDDSGEIVKTVHTSANPIEDYKIGDTEFLTLQADDGTDLYCRMITPPNFDDSKKYPVVVYVYGGPHAQLVKNSWGYGRYSFWFQYMAQHGYIVFTLDNRGSANRGLEFEQATFRNLGTVEVKDQLVGVDYLKSLHYVDKDRFGVFGWSFGGFMTTSLMTRTNDAFKVGVGGGAVINWEYYEVMYTERYMDTPQTNPEGFEKANLLNHAKDLNGKLLLVHGTNDPTVVWQNTLNFAKKCADLNKPLDYFPYPGHAHGVVGKDALHLYNKISQYFIDNL